MSLKTSIVSKTGATPGLTGGTDVTYVNDGRGVNGTNILVDSSSDNILTRKSLVARAVLGAAAPNVNSFAKLSRSSLSYKQPFTDAAGKVYTGVGLEVTLVSHPEQTGTQKTEMLNDGIAVIVDSELADFFSKSLNA